MNKLLAALVASLAMSFAFAQTPATGSTDAAAAPAGGASAPAASSDMGSKKKATSHKAKSHHKSKKMAKKADKN